MEKAWQRWLFYIDVIVIAIFIIAIVYLVKDAFWAGYYRALGSSYINEYGRAIWHVSKDVAFLTGSLAWFFYRFFRCQFLLLKKP